MEHLRAFAPSMPYAICQSILPFKHKKLPPSELVKANYCNQKKKIAIVLQCNSKGRTALLHYCKTKNILLFFFSLHSVSLTLPLSQVCLPCLSLSNFSLSLCSPSGHRWPLSPSNAKPKPRLTQQRPNPGRRWPLSHPAWSDGSLMAWCGLMGLSNPKLSPSIFDLVGL